MSVNLAPVALFVFNRPEHTRKTIESLKMNPLAGESELTVFSDGPRDKRDEVQVQAVRELVHAIDGFKHVEVREKQANQGLANSVIEGVTEIVRRHGKVIVLEDDLLFSPYFLNYMNEALDRYRNDQRIFSIGGYTPRLEIPESYREDSFLSYRCCTWGWATWDDRWDMVDWEVKDFDAFRHDEASIARFNRGGDDMFQILKAQMAGKISSWGIRWDYAHYKHDAYCFRPVASLVASTGNDGSGIHCVATDKFAVDLSNQSEFSFPPTGELSLDEEMNRRFASFYDGKSRNASKSARKGLTLFRRMLGRIR